MSVCYPFWYVALCVCLLSLSISVIDNVFFSLLRLCAHRYFFNNCADNNDCAHVSRLRLCAHSLLLLSVSPFPVLSVPL